MTAKKHFINITKTKKEWEIIDSLIEEKYNGNANYKSYVKGTLYMLKKRFDECPECIKEERINKKERRRSHISKEVHDLLLHISKISNIKINKLLEIIIIIPILSKKNLLTFSNKNQQDAKKSSI